MKRSTLLFVAVALVVAIWAGVSGLLGSGGMTLAGTSSGAPPESALAGRRFRWPKGRVARYDLTLGSTDGVTVSAEAKAGGATRAFEARTVVSGTLQLTSYGAGEGGHTRLGVRLPALAESTLQLGGQDVLTPADRAALTTSEALVSVSETGELYGVKFLPATPEPVRNLLTQVITETAVTLGPGAAWSAEEASLQGTAESRYRVVQDDAAGLGLARSRDRYAALTAETAGGRTLSQEVRGEAHVTVEGGLIRDLVATETLSVANGTTGGFGQTHSGRVHMALRSVDDEQDVVLAEALLAAPSVRPGALAVRDGFETTQLAQRIDGLTGQQLLETLTQFGNSGQVPEHGRFIWRATALLREHPELCAELVTLYDSEATEPDGRALILDLLVGANTRASQAALRDALTRPRGQGEPAYGVHFQRIGLVEAPDAEMLEFARAHAADPGPEGTAAALASLGAVAGHRLPSGDPAAQQVVTELRAGLVEAETPEAQVAHLRALSNLHIPDVEADVAAFASSDRAAVRAAAARALRRQSGQVARRALVGLAGDGDNEAQRQALSSLAGRGLEAAELESLRQVVEAGRMDEIGYDALLTAVAEDLSRPEARAVIDAVLRQDVQNVRVIARARQLLASVEE